MKIKTILVPVDYPRASLRVVHQAAALARHFQARLVVLHVSTSLPDAARKPGWDPLAALLAQARATGDGTLEQELAGLSIDRRVAEGGPAWVITTLSQEEDADLIMLPSAGATFDQLVLHPVAEGTVSGSERTMWIDTSLDMARSSPLSIQSVLCAIDLRSHTTQTIAWAAALAAQYEARLTLAHVTAGVEMWGPGGKHIDPRLQEALVEPASAQIGRLQQALGIKAEVLIGSGDVPTVLRESIVTSGADVVVVGSRPYGVHLRTTSYSLLGAMPIPVISVCG